MSSSTPAPAPTGANTSTNTATTTTTASQSEYITLVSSDGYSFVVHRRSTDCSETIRKMLSPMSGFREAVEGVVRLMNIEGVILQKIVEYMVYNEKMSQSEGVTDMLIEPENCLELLLAADYLDI